MSEDLFSGMAESLSPREAWCREHRVTVREVHEEEQLNEAGDWEARSGARFCYGKTRDEAQANLARRLWTEKGVKPWSMS